MRRLLWVMMIVVVAACAGDDEPEPRPRADAGPATKPCTALVPDEEQHCYTRCCRVGGINASVTSCTYEKCVMDCASADDGRTCRRNGKTYSCNPKCTIFPCEPCQ